MLREIFGRKKEDIAEDWRGLHNEKLHDLKSSVNIILVIKFRRMGCAVYVTRVGAKRNAHRVG